MPSTLILSLILPLLGAGGTLGLGLVRRMRPYARYIALAAASLETVLVLAVGWVGPVTAVPSLWQPSLLFGTTPMLRTDVMVQPLVLALALATWSSMIVGVGRSDKALPWLRAASLVLLAAGLAALWAANILTMVISWAIYDLVKAFEHMAAGGSRTKAVQGLFFGGLATVFLWGGALLGEDGTGSELWSLVTVGDRQLGLWMVAGALRLWVYPLHLAIPSDLAAASSVAAPLLLGPIIGWGLWLRLALASGGSVPGGALVLVIAAASLGVGSFLAWSSEHARGSLPWVGMGVTGSVLLAAGLAGEAGAVTIAGGGLAWALGVTVLSLSDGLQREALWWSLPALVGALALVGAPLTLGFVTEATLVGWMKGGGLGWGSALFVGYLFLVASLVRRLLLRLSPAASEQRWLAGMRGIGLGVPALVLIVAGLRPPLVIQSDLAPSLRRLLARPGGTGWALWAASLVGGAVLAWQERNVRSKIGLVLNALHDLVRLDWLYAAAAGALERVMSVLRMTADIVGGAGALLWSCLLLLGLLLLWSGR